jgi:hypothetical protein
VQAYSPTIETRALMLDKFHGLPTHVLLIHAVVVLMPMAAVMTALSAVWPAARRKLGFLTPAVALVGLILVPITTHAGEYLESKLPESPAIAKHAHLGHELLPWAIALFVVAAAVYALGRRYDLSWRPASPTGPADAPSEDAPSGSSGGGTATLVRPKAATTATLPVWVTAIVAVVAIGVSTGTSIQLYRIGESGAKAAWGGVVDAPSSGS